MKGAAEHLATLLKMRVDQRKEFAAEDIRQLGIQMTAIEARIARIARNFDAYDKAYAANADAPQQAFGDAD